MKTKHWPFLTHPQSLSLSLSPSTILKTHHQKTEKENTTPIKLSTSPRPTFKLPPATPLTKNSSSKAAQPCLQAFPMAISLPSKNPLPNPPQPQPTQSTRSKSHPRTEEYSCDKASPLPGLGSGFHSHPGFHSSARRLVPS